MYFPSCVSPDGANDDPLPWVEGEDEADAEGAERTVWALPNWNNWNVSRDVEQDAMTMNMGLF